jgi:hypothetical protein
MDWLAERQWRREAFASPFGLTQNPKLRLVLVLVVVLEIFNICPLNPRNKFVRSKIGLILKR